MAKEGESTIPTATTSFPGGALSVEEREGTLLGGLQLPKWVTALGAFWHPQNASALA